MPERRGPSVGVLGHGRGPVLGGRCGRCGRHGRLGERRDPEGGEQPVEPVGQHRLGQVCALPPLVGQRSHVHRLVPRAHEAGEALVAFGGRTQAEVPGIVGQVGAREAGEQDVVLGHEVDQRPLQPLGAAHEALAHRVDHRVRRLDRAVDLDDRQRPALLGQHRRQAVEIAGLEEHLVLDAGRIQRPLDEAVEVGRDHRGEEAAGGQAGDGVVAAVAGVRVERLQDAEVLETALVLDELRLVVGRERARRVARLDELGPQVRAEGLVGEHDQVVGQRAEHDLVDRLPARKAGRWRHGHPGAGEDDERPCLRVRDDLVDAPSYGRHHRATSGVAGHLVAIATLAGHALLGLALVRTSVE